MKELKYKKKKIFCRQQVKRFWPQRFYLTVLICLLKLEKLFVDLFFKSKKIFKVKSS